MKTSFYFVVWILIYPLLGLLDSSFDNHNAFILGLLAVWGLSWLLNRLMPNILTYEHYSQKLPIMEDVYNENIASFKKRLSRDATIAIVTSIYFLITTVVIILAIFEYRINNWIALILLVFFTYGAISRSIDLIKAKLRLNENPVTGVCIEICEHVYKLTYTSYVEDRDFSAIDVMALHEPRMFKIHGPKFYKTFKIISIVFAALAVLLELLSTFVGLSSILGYSSFPSGTVYVGRFLYGSLAMYFGVKDFILFIKQNLAPQQSDNNV